MPKYFYRFLLSTCAFFCFYVNVFGQMPSATSSDIESEFNSARDYFQKGQLSIAYPIFKSLYYDKSVKERSSFVPDALRSDLQFYTFACGLATDDSTVVKPARQFEEQSANAAKGQMISFYLAEYYYRHNDFLNAVAYYSKAGYDNLSKAQASAAKFNKGYSYFALNDFTSAGPLLYTISLDPHDKNYLDANYYYGFVALQEKDFTTALKAFMLAGTSPKYKNTVPYYITEVYYFSGNVDRAIEYGRETLQKNGQMFYASDLQLLLAHAYFDQSDFEKALPFLRTYAATVQKMERIDVYELAFCNYQQGNYDSAIAGFSKLIQLSTYDPSGGGDSVYQNSKYFLATSYLREGQLEKAKQLFLESSKSNGNPEQRENAAYNYVSVTFDLGEYDSAYVYLNKFIEDYPNSSYRQSANDLMVSLLTRNNKFGQAYEFINNIGHQSEAIQQLYPYILYGHSLDLINEEKYWQAKSLLISLVNLQSAGDTTKQLAYFRLGQVYYNLGKYDTAVLAVREYLNNPITRGDVNLQNAHYTLGYIYMQAADYDNSLKQFKALLTKINAKATPIEMDVYRREGDCYFMQRDYKKAIEIYNDLIKNSYQDAAYCYYQIGLIENRTGQSDDAIKYLQLAADKGTGTAFSAHIQMETAQTYILQGNYAKAIPLLDSVIKNKQAGDSLLSKAYLSLGMCGYNTNNFYIAKDAYTKWTLLYGNSENSEEVIESLRRLYSENNRIGGFIDFMKRTKEGISVGQIDSLYYSQAVNLYNNGDWKNAITGFTSYIDKYPNGENVLNAKYMLGNAQDNLKDYAHAVTSYQYLIDHRPNQYTNAATLSIARIYYFKIHDPAKALSYFMQLKSMTNSQDTVLECLRGAIRIQYRQKDWKNAAVNAAELLKYASAYSDDNQIANYVLGENAQSQNNFDEAINYYNKVVSLGKNDYASEAQYNIAEILMNQNKLKDAEKAANVITGKIASSDYWTTKAYILLGQIFYNEKDYYNAGVTLKSVVDNSTDAELKKEAQALLDKVNAAAPSGQTKSGN